MKYIKCPCCNSIEEITYDPQKVGSDRPMLERLVKFDETVNYEGFKAFWCNICGVLFRIMDDDFKKF